MAANPTDGEKARSKQMAGIISRRQQYRAVKGENFYFSTQDTLKNHEISSNLKKLVASKCCIGTLIFL
jgi:hypothetical protein